MEEPRCLVCKCVIGTEYSYLQCCGKRTVYDPLCLTEWLKRTRSCPNCRSLQPDRVDRRRYLNLQPARRRLASDVIVID